MDDVILYISDPLTSLSPKSEAVMLVGRWPPQLDKEVSFNWSAQGFRYLGIMITPLTSQLTNYGSLIAQIRLDLVRWEIHVDKK